MLEGVKEGLLQQIEQKQQENAELEEKLTREVQDKQSIQE